MTCEHAEVICNHRGLDIYCGAFLEDEVLVAYGILRGWDEGFEIPSLGILVSRPHRGRGIGRRVMNALHSLARLRGAESVRLRVAPGNSAARALYEAMGYVFDGTMDRGELVGALRF